MLTVYRVVEKMANSKLEKERNKLSRNVSRVLETQPTLLH